MKQVRTQFLAVGVIAATALAAGCGGGGGDTAPPPVAAPPAPPASVTISGKAVDGALQGAIACYDLNNNNVCDTGEPVSGTSDAAGNFSLSVLASVAGQHRVIVNVPSTAIDADTGQAVGTAFAMVAPASGTTGAQSVFVSPLTTLVARQMDSAGQTMAQAHDYIQAQAGLAVSPLADFTAAANANNAKAANAAKLALLAQRQQASAVVAVVGQNDISGAAITQADLDRAVHTRVITALPSIGAAAADPAVIALTGTAREQALTTSAAAVVASIGFTAEQARFEIGLPKLPQPAAAAPAATGIMPALQYTNASNWFFRANLSTVADNTLDGNGMIRYYSVRTRMAPYAHLPDQGVAESSVRTFNPELHWNGSAWTDCRLGQRDTSTPRDAQGRNSYTSCNNHERGYSQRAEVDISGQTLASVWTNRLLPASQQTNNPAAWALPDVALLGSAVYPAGSSLMFQTNTVTEMAVTYNTTDSNRVSVFSDAVAQGGDARTGTPACAATATAAFGVTLELLAARNPGRPCVFAPATDANGTSLDPNETWGTSSVSMGTLATNVERPAGTGTHYTATRLFRVAFSGGNGTVYLSCLQRTSNTFTRNCTPIGTGTYAISTLGDARIMTFNGLPAQAQALGSTRVFVERGGQVYFGFRIREGTVSTSVRLNLPAANAMLRQLGMPPIQPADAPQALTGAKAANAALLNGLWGMHFPDGNTMLVRFGADGRYLHAQAPTADVSGRPGLELGWADFDVAATAQTGLLLEIDSNNQFGLSHPLATDRITSITSSAITFSDGTVISRFADSGSGLVGVWSTDPTDWHAATFAFFPNGRVLSIHPYAETVGACATARNGPPGVEHAPFTFNASNGALAIGPRTVDSSGCTGLWDIGDAAGAIFNSVVTMATDGRSAVFTLPEGGTVTLYRVAVQ